MKNDIVILNFFIVFSKSFIKILLHSFFSSFSTFFVLSSAALTGQAPPFRTARLDYHISTRLSSPFFASLKNFFQVRPARPAPFRGIPRLSAAGLSAPLQDARLYYQTPASLSTHFFRFFSFFPHSLPSPGTRPRNSTAGGHLPVEFSIAQRHRL